jgi:hypothetical protein
MSPITPQYHPVPTIPENGTHVPLNDNSVSMRTDANMNPIMHQYHPVLTIPENDTHVSLNDSSASMRSDSATDHYGLGIQK